jgi:hypothetical protein
LSEVKEANEVKKVKEVKDFPSQAAAGGDGFVL